MLLLWPIKKYVQYFKISDLGKIDLLNFNYSGSTCVSLLTYGRKLYVGNVGDSRAILIKYSNDSNCLKYLTSY